MTRKERIHNAKGTCADMVLDLTQLEGDIEPSQELIYLENLEEILLEDLRHNIRALTVLAERKLRESKKERAR